MKATFQAILTIEAALKAVERNGYALRYVLTLELFTSIAVKFGFEINS